MLETAEYKTLNTSGALCTLCISFVKLLFFRLKRRNFGSYLRKIVRNISINNLFTGQIVIFMCVHLFSNLVAANLGRLQL